MYSETERHGIRCRNAICNIRVPWATFGIDTTHECPSAKIAINHSRTRGSANNRWLTVPCARQSLNRPFGNLRAPTLYADRLWFCMPRVASWVWQYHRPISRISANWAKLIIKEPVSLTFTRQLIVNCDDSFIWNNNRFCVYSLIFYN